jgi:hypothetical protein
MSDNKQNLPAVVVAALEAAHIDPTKCNLMLPTQTYGAVLGMFDKITFESITVNQDPKAKEVYEPDGEGKGKALSKVPLQRIGLALGIIWDPITTGIVVDDDIKSRAKATGAIRKPNGEPVVITEEKTINALFLGERDRISIEERADRGNPDKVAKWGTTTKGKRYPEEFEPWTSEEQKRIWIDRAVRKAVIQHQLTKNEKANTGAKERVIRALIAMKSTYTDEELAKPFVYPCVSIDAGKMLANSDMRAAAVERMSSSVLTIFGPRPGNGEMKDVTPGKLAIEADAGSMEPASTALGQGSQPAAEAHPAEGGEPADGAGAEEAIDFGGDGKKDEHAPWETLSPAEQFIETLKHCSPTNEVAGLKWLETKPKDAEILAAIKRTNAALDKFEADKQKAAEKAHAAAAANGGAA